MDDLTRPDKPEQPQLATCDWGHCDNAAVDSRWSDSYHGWLPVCINHVEDDLTYFYVCLDCQAPGRLIMRFEDPAERNGAAREHVERTFHRVNLFSRPKPEPLYATAVKSGDDERNYP